MNWRDRVFRAMETESEKYGLPKYYRDDLFKHDKGNLQCLTENQPFVWVLRECGTEFYHLRAYLGALRFWLYNSHDSNNCICYYWDTKELIPITKKEAEKRIASLP